MSLVDLDEGFRIMSRVVDGPVAIGTRVRVAFEDGVPVFAAADGPARTDEAAAASRAGDA